MSTTLWDHVWWWRVRPIGQDRKGQQCRVLARGRKNSVLVEFQDGYQVLTSRYAVRREAPVEPAQLTLGNMEPQCPKR